MTPKTKKINDKEVATKADVAKVSDDVAKVSANVARVSDDVDNLAIATKNAFDRVEAKMATKDDLKAFATKDDLKAFATKDDLKAFATKESQERILSIVESIDDHFKEHRDILKKSGTVGSGRLQTPDPPALNLNLKFKP